MSVEFDVEKNAMHNNFAWSSAFSGNEFISAGNNQVEKFMKAIVKMTSPEVKKMTKQEL